MSSLPPKGMKGRTASMISVKEQAVDGRSLGQLAVPSTSDSVSSLPDCLPISPTTSSSISAYSQDSPTTPTPIPTKTLAATTSISIPHIFSPFHARPPVPPPKRGPPAAFQAENAGAVAVPALTIRKAQRMTSGRIEQGIPVTLTMSPKADAAQTPTFATHAARQAVTYPRISRTSSASTIRAYQPHHRATGDRADGESLDSQKPSSTRPTLSARRHSYTNTSLYSQKSHENATDPSPSPVYTRSAPAVPVESRQKFRRASSNSYLPSSNPGSSDVSPSIHLHGVRDRRSETTALRLRSYRPNTSPQPMDSFIRPDDNPPIMSRIRSNSAPPSPQELLPVPPPKSLRQSEYSRAIANTTARLNLHKPSPAPSGVSEARGSSISAAKYQSLSKFPVAPPDARPPPMVRYPDDSQVSSPVRGSWALVEHPQSPINTIRNSENTTLGIDLAHLIVAVHDAYREVDEPSDGTRRFAKAFSGFKKQLHKPGDASAPLVARYAQALLEVEEYEERYLALDGGSLETSDLFKGFWRIMRLLDASRADDQDPSIQPPKLTRKHSFSGSLQRTSSMLRSAARGVLNTSTAEDAQVERTIFKIQLLLDAVKGKASARPMDFVVEFRKSLKSHPTLLYLLDHLPSPSEYIASCRSLQYEDTFLEGGSESHASGETALSSEWVMLPDLVKLVTDSQPAWRQSNLFHEISDTFCLFLGYAAELTTKAVLDLLVARYQGPLHRLRDLQGMVGDFTIQDKIAVLALLLHWAEEHRCSGQNGTPFRFVGWLMDISRFLGRDVEKDRASFEAGGHDELAKLDRALDSLREISSLWKTPPPASLAPDSRRTKDEANFTIKDALTMDLLHWNTDNGVEHLSRVLAQMEWEILSSGITVEQVLDPAFPRRVEGFAVAVQRWVTHELGRTKRVAIYEFFVKLMHRCYISKNYSGAFILRKALPIDDDAGVSVSSLYQEVDAYFLTARPDWKNEPRSHSYGATPPLLQLVERLRDFTKERGSPEPMLPEGAVPLRKYNRLRWFAHALQNCTSERAKMIACKPCDPILYDGFKRRMFELPHDEFSSLNWPRHI